MLRGIAEHPWVVFVEQPRVDEQARVEEPRSEPPRGFRGELSASGLVDLVQVVAITTPTGALHVEATGGAGTLWFEGGAIVHAVSGEERGAAAFLRMLQWQAGSFRLDARAPAPERSIDLSTTQLLLESARALDEQHVGSAPTAQPERAAE